MAGKPSRHQREDIAEVQMEEYAVIPFDRVCLANNIDHRLTKIRHPWTNGQVERMNRTLKEATVKKYYDQTHEQLKSHMPPDGIQLRPTA